MSYRIVSVHQRTIRTTPPQQQEDGCLDVICKGIGVIFLGMIGFIVVVNILAFLFGS